MQYNYTAFAIPGVLFFILLEYLYAKRRKKIDVYKYDSSVANLSIGIADRLMDLFFSASFYSIYYFVYEHFHLLEIGKQWYVWILLLLATDLVWYWYHRLGHEINLLWAAHIVHHQSEEFNYTAATRITIFQALVRTAFWSILPLLGFHPDMVIPVLLLHGVYSFFTHTRMIGKLGFLEKVLITPSHHRVHHAADEKYLDKNYGDIFVFWDKLFGTFQAEEEEPKYGIVHPLNSHNFLWQHFHYYLEIWVTFKRAKTGREKWNALFAGPETMSPTIRKALERKLRIHKRKDNTKNAFKTYLNLQMVLVLLSLFALMLFYPMLPFDTIVAISSGILITLVYCGSMLEQQRYIYHLEMVRLFIPIAYICYHYSYPLFFFVCAVILALLLFSHSLERAYHNLFFFHHSPLVKPDVQTKPASVCFKSKYF